MLIRLSRPTFVARRSTRSLELTRQPKNKPHVIDTVSVEAEAMRVVFAVQQLLHIGANTRRQGKRVTSILFGQLFKEQLCFLLSKRSHSPAGIHELICGFFALFLNLPESIVFSFVVV